MPRTKFRKGFKLHPIIVMNRLDCFGGHEYGMRTQMVLAREIKWTPKPWKGEVFLIHKVPGRHRLWTISHADSGTDLIGWQDWPESEAEAKVVAASILRTLKRPNKHHVTEKQMIALSRKSGTPWGGKKEDPMSVIQKNFISEGIVK